MSFLSIEERVAHPPCLDRQWATKPDARTIMVGGETITLARGAQLQVTVGARIRMGLRMERPPHPGGRLQPLLDAPSSGLKAFRS